MVTETQDAKHLYYLSCAPLFKGISEHHLLTLARACRWRQFARGQFLFLQGDTAAAAYVICSGWIVIALNSPDGRELAIREMRDGDLFGENAIIGNIPRSASAFAREASEVLEVPRAAFLDVLANEPVFTHRLLEIAVTRLAEANARESALAFLSAPARVARVLREMDEKDRSTDDRGYVTLSQEELALRTGLTRQTVARFLSDWRRSGWLQTGRGRIVLLNRPALLEVEKRSTF